MGRLLGAVDNNRSRQLCHRVFSQARELICIDSGNGEYTGQVVCGVRRSGKTYIHVDPPLPPAERIQEAARQMKGNPFVYRCGGLLVKTSFAGTRSLQAVLEECLERSKMTAPVKLTLYTERKS